MYVNTYICVIYLVSGEKNKKEKPHVAPSIHPPSP